METVGSALPKEMTRIRDVLIPQYQSIGPAGGFAIMMMRNELDRATKALAEGDVVAMVKSLALSETFRNSADRTGVRTHASLS
jgi:hypothetical protein